MSAGQTVETQTLDAWLNAVAPTLPADIWIALSTADPLDDGSGLAEPVGNGYARKQISGSPRFTVTGVVSGASTAENDEVQEFPEATGSWGTLTHVAIMDAASGGNVLFHGALTTPVTVAANETIRFNINSLTVTAD